MKKVTNYLYAILVLSLVLSFVMAVLGIVNTQTAEAAAAVYTSSATLPAEATAAAKPVAKKSASAAQTPAKTDVSMEESAPEKSVVPGTLAARETPGASETPVPAPEPSAEPTPTPTEGARAGAAAERGDNPSIYVPLDESQLNGIYTIENARFGIDSTGGNARATTDGINAALRWAKEQGFTTVKFEKGTYMIQCNWRNRFIAPTDGILVPSGLTLDLNGSTFMMEPNSYPEYCIFGIVNAKDVTIKNGKLIGDLDNHVYAKSSASPTHEFGFGVVISASTNVTIRNLTITKMTGDGIIVEGSYTALADGGMVSTNVRLLDNDISNCRRQGISIIGARNSEIAGNRIYNISGTNPQYGIDIEKELDYIVDKLKIHDNAIYNCSGGAISCHSGNDYEVYNNICSGNIIAVFSSNIRIYGNTIKDSFINVIEGASNITVENNILEGNSWIKA
ncbi:MAG: right-handed parallel beta-helix repeat-containing protein [Christensenellales bacterium]|jgi:parallel beta-helix repeat protein